MIKDDLVAGCIEDVGEGADTLPLVALTLSRLYADYGSTGEISAVRLRGHGRHGRRRQQRNRASSSTQYSART